ncbi:MAG: MarR family transcriptional regulator [Pseudomonadota bacterium]
MAGAQRERLESGSWLAVVRAYERCSRLYSELLKPFELTTPQYDLLLAIQKLGGSAMPHELANAMYVTRGNITGLMKRLEAQGLMRRRRHENDGRAQVCELTYEATELLASANQAAARFIKAQLEPFDDRTLMRIERDMNEMAAHLNTLDPLAIAQEVHNDR